MLGNGRSIGLGLPQGPLQGARVQEQLRRRRPAPLYGLPGWVPPADSAIPRGDDESRRQRHAAVADRVRLGIGGPRHASASTRASRVRRRCSGTPSRCSWPTASAWNVQRLYLVPVARSAPLPGGWRVQLLRQRGALEERTATRSPPTARSGASRPRRARPRRASPGGRPREASPGTHPDLLLQTRTSPARPSSAGSTRASSSPVARPTRRRRSRTAPTPSPSRRSTPPGTRARSSRGPSPSTPTPPPAPQITDTDPNSPANDNAPEVKGTAAAGSIVRLFKTAGCTGHRGGPGLGRHVRLARHHRLGRQQHDDGLPRQGDRRRRQRLALLGRLHLRRGLDAVGSSRPRPFQPNVATAGDHWAPGAPRSPPDGRYYGGDAPQEPAHPGTGRQPAADRRRGGRRRHRRQSDLRPRRAARARAGAGARGRADDPRQRVHAPAALPAPGAPGRRDGAGRPLPPARQPGLDGRRTHRPRGGRQAPARVPRHARATRGRAATHLERRARRPGGGARSGRPRPPRRGQPVADRAPAAARGGARQGAGRAGARARRHQGARQPGDGGAPDAGASAPPHRARRPRPQGRAGRPRQGAGPAGKDRGQLRGATATSPPCPPTCSWSSTGWRRRPSRTPPATRAPRPSASACGAKAGRSS